MDKLPKDFLDSYFFGSYWAFRHYDKIIRRAFNHLPQKPKVAVEVGCGVGMATYFLSKQVHHLICIDTNEEYIQRVNPDPALKRGALGSPGLTAFIPVINHGAFCGAG